AALPIFVPHAENPKFTNDELYGSTEKKKVGDQWDMDIKNKGEALGLNPAKTTGTVKLDAVKTENGTKWLQLTETLDSTEINDPTLGKAKDAKLSVKVVDMLPLDVSNPSEKSQSTRQMRGTFTAPQQDGTTAKVTLDRTEKRDSSMRLITAAATQAATQAK